MQRAMLSTVNLPLNGGCWYRSLHHAEEPVRVTYDQHFDSAMTDSAKQAALQKMPQLSGSASDIPNRTWPAASGQAVHRVNVVCNDTNQPDNDDDENDDEDVFSSPRGAGSSTNYWLQDTNPELLGSMAQRHMEVMEHSVSRTRHIFHPHTPLHLNNVADDGREMISDDDEHNMTWNSGTTEPDMTTSLTDTKEGETQTPRHRKTQTLEYVGTQTPRGHRKLPTIPGLEAVSGEILGDDVEDDNHPTNPILMKTMICPGTRSTERGQTHRLADIGSLSLQATRDATQQPEYLRDYQRYIESFDGTTSGPFMHQTRENNDPETIPHRDVELRWPQGRDSEQRRDDVTMPSTTQPNNTMSRDSTAWAETAVSTSPVVTQDRILNSESRTMTQNWFQASKNSKENDDTSKFMTGRAFLSGTFPLDSSSNVRYVWHPRNQSGEKKDFSQQTLVTSGTQTPLRIILSHGTSAELDTLVIDSEGVGHALSLGLEPWTLLSTRDLDNQHPSRDFSTQTFGQWYDDYYSHTGTQTQVSARCLYGSGVADSMTQTVSDDATQTTPTTEILMQSGRHTPTVHQPGLFAANTFQPVKFQSGLYPRVSVPPAQSTVSEEEDQVRSHAGSRHSSRKDRNKTRKEKKRRETSRERSNERETEDNQSVMTSQTNMSRRDLLKFMLKQVKDLKQKLDPESSKEEKKASKSKQKEKSRSKSKKHKPRDDDSAIESYEEDGDIDDKLYTRRRLELLYNISHDVSGVATDNEARTYRRQRRHSIESIHSDKGDYRDESRDRAYDKLRERYLPRSVLSRSSGMRKAYTPPPRPYYRATYPRDMPPPPIYPYSRGRSPVRRVPPSRRQLPHVPPPVPSHLMVQPAAYPNQIQAPPLQYNPQPLYPMTPTASQQYIQPQTPVGTVCTPVQPGQGYFRPISAQPNQQMTPAPASQVLLVPNKPTVQNSPHPPYIVLSSPTKYESANEGERCERKSRRPRPASAQPAVSGSSLDKSLSKAAHAAREMKSLTKKMTKK